MEICLYHKLIPIDDNIVSYQNLNYAWARILESYGMLQVYDVVNHKIRHAMLTL